MASGVINWPVAVCHAWGWAWFGDSARIWSPKTSAVAAIPSAIETTSDRILIHLKRFTDVLFITSPSGCRLELLGVVSLCLLIPLQMASRIRISAMTKDRRETLIRDEGLFKRPLRVCDF
jgi:hypothetical protein